MEATVADTLSRTFQGKSYTFKKNLNIREGMLRLARRSELTQGNYAQWIQSSSPVEYAAAVQADCISQLEIRIETLPEGITFAPFATLGEDCVPEIIELWRSLGMEWRFLHEATGEDGAPEGDSGDAGSSTSPTE